MPALIVVFCSVSLLLVFLELGSWAQQNCASWQFYAKEYCEGVAINLGSAGAEAILFGGMLGVVLQFHSTWMAVRQLRNDVKRVALQEVLARWERLSGFLWRIQIELCHIKSSNNSWLTLRRVRFLGAGGCGPLKCEKLVFRKCKIEGMKFAAGGHLKDVQFLDCEVRGMVAKNLSIASTRRDLPLGCKGTWAFVDFRNSSWRGVDIETVSISHMLLGGADLDSSSTLPRCLYQRLSDFEMIAFTEHGIRVLTVAEYWPIFIGIIKRGHFVKTARIAWYMLNQMIVVLRLHLFRI